MSLPCCKAAARHAPALTHIKSIRQAGSVLMPPGHLSQAASSVQGVPCFELEILQPAAAVVRLEAAASPSPETTAVADPEASPYPAPSQHKIQLHMLYQQSYQVPTMALRGSASGEPGCQTTVAEQMPGNAVH